MKVLSPHAVFVALVVLVVGAAVTAGLVLSGSPSEARIERLDARRVEDLQMLSRLIDVHWAKHGRLPASLDEVTLDPRGTDARDPVTGQPYAFRPTGEKRYELCAGFDRRSTDASRQPGEEFWAHEAGRGCFPLEVRTPGR
ncbi:MAG TPA: hypothetical protein VES67_06430 [Vicinamibacterales bacterium]|nr:hypothetical protein [Vicinamibacterales bacterium]